MSATYTTQQRLAALDRANEVRLSRSELKRAVKAGRVSVASLLLDPPWFIDSMRVYDLLLLTPRFPRATAGALLARCEVRSLGRTVGSLSERQRRELASMLRSRS